jgi:hypothetical protein
MVTGMNANKLAEGVTSQFEIGAQSLLILFVFTLVLHRICYFANYIL